MRITNDSGLPETLYRAICNAEAEYSKGDADYSCTELIDPPRLTLLKQRHRDAITTDALDLLWAFLGKLGHALAERAGADNAFVEERLFAEIASKRISGASDLAKWVFHNGKITDYKFTKVYAIKFGSRIADWEAQQNIYAWLFRKHGFEVTSLEICAVLIDWRPGEARRDPDYPPRVKLIPLRLWTEAEQEHYIRNRLTVLIGYESMPDGELPECTPEEMWEAPTRYAAMKTGRKSAVRVLDAEQDAIAVVTTGKATHVEVRHGGRKRCEAYCAVAPFCSQWKAWSGSHQVEEAEETS